MRLWRFSYLYLPVVINKTSTMKSLALLTALCCLFFVTNAQTKNYIDQPFIEVNGSADTLVTPNEIFLNINLSEKDTRDKLSIQQLEVKMMKALTSIGINLEKDLTTADMESNFKYYLLKNKEIIKTKRFLLKVADAQTASQVFIKLEEQEISNVEIDRVGHSDLKNIQRTMQMRAVEDAKSKALYLTKPLNQSVGQAIFIAEAENFLPPLAVRAAGIKIRGATSFSNDWQELPKIEFEKIKVASTISAKFILK
jgi:uncharacterized protein